MTRTTLVGTALLALCLACAHGQSTSATKESTAPAPSRAARADAGGAPPAGHMAAMCPMAVEGTQVAVADTADGATVTFTTTPDRAADLRSRVRAMADMHNAHHSGDARTTPSGHAGMEGHGAGGMHGGGMPGMMPPPSLAAAEDVENGARIVVTPKDPADLPTLRSTIRAHAEHMQQEGCGPGMGGPAR